MFSLRCLRRPASAVYVVTFRNVPLGAYPTMNLAKQTVERSFGRPCLLWTTLSANVCEALVGADDEPVTVCRVSVSDTAEELFRNTAPHGAESR